MEQRHIPGGTGQQAIDQGGLEGPILELLDKGRLVEGDAGGEGLGDDTLALGDELRGKPRRGDRSVIGAGGAR